MKKNISTKKVTLKSEKIRELTRGLHLVAGGTGQGGESKGVSGCLHCPVQPNEL